MTITLNDSSADDIFPLPSDEVALVGEMLEQIKQYAHKNKLKQDYYEGKHKLDQPGISIPPHMRDLKTVVGWPAITVDGLNERLDWQGWTSDTGEDFGLRQVYVENQLNVDSGQAHLDALIFGTSFVVVGAGFAGEPSPLVTIESPFNMTGIWDKRIRRLSAALGVNRTKDGEAVEATLYLPNSNVRIEFRNGTWYEIERNTHGIGRVLVAQIINSPRASDRMGKSEITRAVRSLTDEGAKTLLGMAVNREFYSAPQRWIMNVDEAAFQDADGNPVNPWQMIMGRMAAYPTALDEDGKPLPEPKMGQFEPASPAPYLDQIKGLAQMASSEAALPASYFGFTTENPPSADAIRALESRLIKRAEQRQVMFERGWTEVGQLILLVRDGKLPDDFQNLVCKWRDPATPTRSAAADEVTKLVAAGVLAADSEIVLRRIGLSAQEIAQVQSERRKSNATQRLQNIADAVKKVSGTPPDAPVAEE